MNNTACGLDLDQLQAPADLYYEHSPNTRTRDMFKYILIPTDGSELSEIAIKAGVGFAKSIGA